MMLIFTQILLQLLGFTLLSLSLARHYSQVSQQAQRPTKATVWLFRACGYTLLIIAVICALNSWGLVLGLVYSLATATLVATCLTLCLTYKPNYIGFIIAKLKLVK